MERNPVLVAGQQLSGMLRLGTPEQVKQAEANLAEAYLERYVDRAILDGVDATTRRRIAKRLVAGEVQQ